MLPLCDIQIDTFEHVESRFAITVILVNSLQGDDGSFHGEVGPRPREPRLPLPDSPLGLEPRSPELWGEGLSSTTEFVTESGL